MKRFLLLLAVACVGLASCSETLDAEDEREEGWAYIMLFHGILKAE